MVKIHTSIMGQNLSPQTIAFNYQMANKEMRRKKADKEEDMLLSQKIDMLLSHQCSCKTTGK